MDKNHYLSSLFSPKNIAVIGSYDNNIRLVWQTVLAHLLDSENFNKIIPINISSKNIVIGDIKVYKSLSQVDNPQSIDVIIVTLTFDYYPKIVKLCNKYNIKYIIFIKSQSQIISKDKLNINKAQKLAKKYNIRLLGVGYIGLIRPFDIMATVYKHKILSGNIALISQSSDICWSLLEWAYSKKIGFSTVISLVDIISDIDFGEILDFLINDKNTSSVILHIDHIKNLKVLLNSLRYVSRVKPLIIIKTGRFRESYVNNLLKENSNITFDGIFTDVLSSLGIMQIDTFDKLFTSIRVLVSKYTAKGDRLAIIGNSYGLSVLAADKAKDLNIKLSEFNSKTISSLKKILSISAVQNPIDMRYKYSITKFKNIIKLCLDDNTVDGVLVVCSPTTKNDSLSIASIISNLQYSTKKPILLSWVENFNYDIDNIFSSNNISLYFNNPEQSIEAFYNLVMIASTRKITSSIPKYTYEGIDKYNYTQINSILRNAKKKNISILSEEDSRNVLRAFNIDCEDNLIIRSKDEALDIALKIGFPVLMKIESENIIYKKYEDRIVFNINNSDQLESAYLLLNKVRLSFNKSTKANICLQKMPSSINIREVNISIIHEKLFGPVIVFASGETSEFLDRAYAIPPLNNMSIEYLKNNTIIGKILIKDEIINQSGHRDYISDTLYSLSNLVTEYKQIQELSIKLLISKTEAVIVDCKIILHEKIEFPKNPIDKYNHMAIMPYPRNLERQVVLKDKTTIMIRPIRIFDAILFQNFVKNLSDKSRYTRFMFHIKEINNNYLINLTQVNFGRDMGLVAVVKDAQGHNIIVGHCLYIRDLNLSSCEFGVLIDDNWQSKGLGILMMKYLFEIAISNNIKLMRGQIFEDNVKMYRLVKKLGFKFIRDIKEDKIIFLEKELIKNK